MGCLDFRSIVTAPLAANIRLLATGRCLFHLLRTCRFEHCLDNCICTIPQQSSDFVKLNVEM